ncbi:MAG TPA: valine--tRNA ligase [Chthoniobacterales bacterium]|jgi:valyl-tRNA synthetase|nr:valine--tRNA ligase [Chthoniobacterales bacterium]
MSELPKTYDPKTVEPKWYARWIDHCDFKADPNSSKQAFSIVIPPPNVTGILTLGHVLNNTIQDVLARRARMRGFEVLWLPGTDHAGIGTQTAVEKHLRRTEKRTRHDLGREEFLLRVLEWQDKHGGIIIEQLKRLGCSCDWSRERYTFDEDYIRAVQGVFVDLYRKGLIYRGRRMINWDPAAQTALSDEEVVKKPQKGKLYFVRYEIVEEPGRFVEVATTRPETIMADTGVAFYPKDKRYADLLGKHAWRPLAREKLPIVADDAIDPEFGTGVLKVTPAHDKVDFEVGQRHKLPVVDVLHPDGHINCPAVPELDGMDRFEARTKAAELLEERGLLSKTEPYENNIGFSDRSEVPIEPRLSEQWFLRYPKTKEALAVVQEHLIRFFPAHWEKVYAQWLENIQDWCISRQVWWGHRIPAWYRKSKSAEAGVSPAKQRNAADTAASTEERNIRVQIESPDTDWTQDPDTLDTWFSSWLWAYETMDEETRTKFYPTSVLVTAPDIIFFWVARMIIAGLEFKPGKSERDEDNIPFRNVYFTGLIRDKQGRKMSKSLGNSPDPLDLIDKYGADGLRFGLMRIAPSGQDIRFDEKQIEEGRNFATKLWNAARFRQMHGPSAAAPKIDNKQLSIYAIELLARLNETIDAIDAAYREYQFNVVAQRLYDFFWSDYCDWFVEAAKTDIFSDDEAKKKSALAVMDFVLSASLRLLHPFMPHITEELWSLLGLGKDSIQFIRPPEKIALEDADLTKKRELVSAIYDTVQTGRNLRAEAGIPSNKKAQFGVNPSIRGIEEQLATLSRLLTAETVSISGSVPATGVVGLSAIGEVWVNADQRDLGAERERLNKEIAKLEDELRTVKSKLGNKPFVDRAPAAVVEEHRQRQRNFSEQLVKLRKAREDLN